jgi:hypothetical protein
MPIDFKTVRANGARGLLDWPEADDPLHARVLVPRGAFHWISDDDIQACLDSGHMENISVPRVEGKSHDAARIASMAAILLTGGQLCTILVTLTRRDLPAGDPHLFELSVIDGSHRLRAYQFCRRLKGIRAVFWDVAGAAALFPLFSPTPL